MSDFKVCVVCGAGSHRKDWINVSGDEVACDFHTKEDIARATDKKARGAAKPVDGKMPPVKMGAVAPIVDPNANPPVPPPAVVDPNANQLGQTTPPSVAESLEKLKSASGSN